MKSTSAERPPTWRELAERLRDLMRDLMNDAIREGRDLERDFEPRLLSALKRMKAEIEKAIAKLENRVEKK